jgi:hypothetical protein
MPAPGIFLLKGESTKCKEQKNGSASAKPPCRCKKEHGYG